MINVHQITPWQQRLSRTEARTLAAAGAARWLVVDSGCLWLTRRDSHGLRDDDVWLGAGEAIELPPRSEWVLQAWPQAVFGLRQPN